MIVVDLQEVDIKIHVSEQILSSTSETVPPKLAPYVSMYSVSSENPADFVGPIS